MKKIIIANDHGAVDLKFEVVAHLESRGYEVVDLGVKVEDRVDYPDMAKVACDEFLKGGYEWGVVLCGTGIGISIAANKINGIRCALLHNCFTAQMAREHNDANFIAFGGRIEYSESVASMLDTFIDASFGEGRHAERVAKIMNMETL